jgi:hypothetical protein
MTETTEAIEHRALVAQLTALVSELRSLRERMTEPGAVPPTFTAVTDSLAGLNPEPALKTYLQELGAILDQHSSEAIDADLDARWRVAMTHPTDRPGAR